MKCFFSNRQSNKTKAQDSAGSSQAAKETLDNNKDAYLAARRKTEHVVRAGIITAFVWLCLILARVLPFMSLSMRLLGVFFLIAGILRLGLPTGALIYLAANLLSFAYPGILANLSFLIYFAPYALIAFALNRYSSSKYLVLLRVTIGTALFVLLISIYGEGFLPSSLQSRVADHYWPLMLLLGCLGSAVYDYFLALLALFYQRHISRFI